MTRHQPPGTWRGESYYDQPPLKNPHWNWTVSGYIALLGISGAAQALAWIGGLRDRAGFRHAQRNARLMSLAGAAAGTGLLIADLKTPKRFYNMLRILRPTSPMSFGSYILSAFGLTVSVATLQDFWPARQRPVFRAVTDTAQAAAAFTGAGVATYTASLMSATSNPYWSATPRLLGAQFATSAMASGAAALALAERLGGRRRIAERLEVVAVVASAAHLAATWLAKRWHRSLGVEKPATDAQPLETPNADLLIAGVVPLVAYSLARASGRSGGTAAVVGSLAVLAGGWLMRDGVLNAGKRAAARPEVAFRAAQPRQFPGTDRRRRRIGSA